MLTKDEIKAGLNGSEAWVNRALIVLWESQEWDEKSTGSTIYENGIGFNGVDANFLTSLAQWVLDGKRLSAKQLKWARHKLPKYWKQLAKAADAKTKAETKAEKAEDDADDFDYEAAIMDSERRNDMGE